MRPGTGRTQRPSAYATGAFRSRCLGAVLVVGAPAEGLPAPPGGPSGAELVLDWRLQADDCPDGPDVLRDVEHVLGRSLRDNATDPVEARATGTAGEDGFRMRLELGTLHGRGVRVFEAESCQVLASVAALYLALAIDPSAVVDSEVVSRPAPDPRRPPRPAALPGPVPTVSGDAPPRTPTPTSTLTAGRPKAAPPAQRRSVRAGLRAQFAGSLGLLPGVAPGAGGMLVLLWPRWRLELGGTYWPGRTLRIDGAPGAGLEVRQGTGVVRGCPVFRHRTLEFPVCVALELGAASALAFGVTGPARVRSPWVAADVGPAMAWAPSPWLAAWIHAEAVLPLVRPGFGVGNVGELHRASPVAGQLTLGLEIRFP